jgi:hypothetical protein
MVLNLLRVEKYLTTSYLPFDAQYQLSFYLLEWPHLGHLSWEVNQLQKGSAMKEDWPKDLSKIGTSEG